MIQILGLRSFEKDGATITYETFLENKWRAPSVPHLIKNYKDYLKSIPGREHYNLFYTLSTCLEEKGRKFVSQKVLPLDLDGIDFDRKDEVINVVCTELGLDPLKTGIVWSGNGLHFLIEVKEEWVVTEYFQNMRPYYSALCGRVAMALFNSGLRCDVVDPVVFSAARLLRLPGTKNIKEGKGETDCFLIQGNIEEQNVDVVSLSDLPRLQMEDAIGLKSLVKMPKPDTQAVQQGCGFLVHCKENQDTITEPQWYAMLSIIGRLENGEQLVHEYSERHPQYRKAATDTKLKHALEASGPRTCANIGTMFDCTKCVHFQQITSPITIRGEDFIRTKETGFYNMKLDKSGSWVKSTPNYDDMAKQFFKDHPYACVEFIGDTYLWNKTHYYETSSEYIYNYAERHFDPPPSNTMCNEFEAKLRRSIIIKAEDMECMDKLNFNNGVLDLVDFSFRPHSYDQYFTYVIPYNYEPDNMSSPVFDKFMSDIMCGDQELINLTMEMLAFAVCNGDPAIIQKTLIMYGDGSNGKSVLLNLIRDLIGTKNCSSVAIEQLSNPNGRASMMNKFVNFVSEAPVRALTETADFKALTAGESVMVKKLYKDPMEWRCTTKIMFAVNALPALTEFSYGIQRRLVIVPFNAVFSDERGNIDRFISEKLKLERPAIMNKMIATFVSLRKRGFKLTESTQAKSLLEDYFLEADSVQKFVNEKVRQSYGSRTTIDIIYMCYKEWCDDVGHNPSTKISFGKRFAKCMEGGRLSFSRGRTTDAAKKYFYEDVIVDSSSNF